MHGTCKESQTPFSHQYIKVQHHFISKKTKKSKNMFKVLTNGKYDRGCANQIACK
jgi:hypothetical protein